MSYAECHYAECHYAEYHYAECHYAECHYAECRLLNVMAPINDRLDSKLDYNGRFHNSFLRA